MHGLIETPRKRGALCGFSGGVDECANAQDWERYRFAVCSFQSLSSKKGCELRLDYEHEMYQVSFVLSASPCFNALHSCLGILYHSSR